MFKKSLLMLALAMLLVTGCKNTMEGVGEDTEKAGEKIQEKSH
jgi:predicted small secreted protein